MKEHQNKRNRRVSWVPTNDGHRLFFFVGSLPKKCTYRHLEMKNGDVFWNPETETLTETKPDTGTLIQLKRKLKLKLEREQNDSS